MPVIPSIQSLVGAHSSGGLGVADWSRNRFFEAGSSFLARYGLLTGLEEAFVSNSNIGGTGQNIAPDGPGLQTNGSVFVGASNLLSAGAAVSLTADFSAVTYIAFPAPNFPGGTHIGVTAGGIQYDFNTGPGNSVISVLNRVQELNSTTWLAEQDNVGVGCRACAGPAGSGIVYVLSAPGTGAPTTLSKVLFDGLGFVSNTIVGTFAATDIDPAWTSGFGPNGVCLDQTDNKLLVMVTGSPGTHRGYICKINPTTAAVEWATGLPTTDGGGPVIPGNAFSWSDIKHQRVGFYSGSPATVTIYDTSDGSIDSSYSSGLAGLHIGVNAQAYNDSLGCCVLTCDFTNGAGSPTLLNSTPSSWSDGWAVLYVAAGFVPPSAAGRRWQALIGPLRVHFPNPDVFNLRVTETGDQRVTMAGDDRITQ